MSLGISVTLAGASDPQLPQVAITGLTVSTAFTLTGSLASGWSWTVPGGNGQVATASTMILADALAPVGAAITYTAVQATTVSASPITVPFVAAAPVLLSSLDGQTVVPAEWMADDGGLEQVPRVALFQVPGRAAPVSRWDVASSEAGTKVLEVDGVASATLRSLIRTGAPVVFRTNGALLDEDPVQVWIVTKAPRTLIGPVTTVRHFAISFQVIDHPLPSALLAASDWDDFDSGWSLLTWDDFDTYFSGLTWDDFDTTDWTTF